MSTLTLEESDSWQSYEASLPSSQMFHQRNVSAHRSLETSARDSFFALQPQKCKSNDLSDLTLDKLRFDSLGLYGRDKEIAILNEELESLVSSSNGNRRVVLISGTSGAGKTKLAETLRFPTFRKKGLFVKGKFDLNLRSQPYSGISNACAEICGSILESQVLQPTRAADICKEIEETLADELVLLIQAIPMLVEIVHRPDPAMEQRQSRSSDTSSSNKSKHRIQYAFVRFMRLITKYFSPLVFVLDDLQWADASSLDLLDVLIADRQNVKLMVMGMYRPNEVNETPVFFRFLEELKEKTHDKDLSLTHLWIENLDIHAVNDIIQDLMHCEDSRTLDLAEICIKKTHGNPFFLLHFIYMLYEHKLLLFNYATLSWSWNVEAIATSTSACDNVVGLLQDQMNNLPFHLLELLKLASCLGSTFDQHHIQRVWKKFLDDSPEQDCDKLITNALHELGDAGLIIKVSQTPLRFSWVHDKIQEAAADLIPDSERNSFSRTIGQILLSELGVDELDSLIFVVVNLLNSPSIDDWDPERRLELSGLNLSASQKAIKVSAFESAAKYAGKGITLLLDNAWDVDTYQLSLQLYSVGAKAEGYLGNVETMETYCRAVILREDVPFKDKLDVYSTWVEGIANRSEMAEAASLTFQILDKFHCRFPNNTAMLRVGIIGNLLRIKTTMKSRSPSKLSPMNDETMVQMMKLLDQLFTYLYALNDDRMPLIVFRSLNWTFKYGICSYSPPAFATTGIMLTGILDDIQGGATYGQHALSLSDETNSTSTAARTMFVVHSFLFPWTRPIREVLKPLLQAYDLGLQTGDTASATFAIYQWLVFKFQLGTSLESLDADATIYLQQMNDLKRTQVVKLTVMLHQVILNLIGHDNTDDPTRFYGKAFSEEMLKMSRDKPCWHAGVCRYHGVLLSFFGEHTRQADMMVEMGHDYLAKAQVASACIMHDTYLKGVSSFIAARQTGKSKYAKLAEICRSKIKKWIRMGNPNIKHYECLLDAEAMAYKGKSLEAIKYFEMAILKSARGGFQHDAAFASELLGEFQISVVKDNEEGAYRLQEAAKYWRGWGALAKIQALERSYPRVFIRRAPAEIFALNISVSSHNTSGSDSMSRKKGSEMILTDCPHET